MWQAIPAVIGAVGSYMSAKEANKGGQEVTPTEPAEVTALKVALAKKGIDINALVTPELLQGTLEDINIDDITTQASPYETAVGDDVLARLKSGTGLSEEELALREQVQIDEDRRFQESIADTASQMAYSGQKLGATTGSQLGGLRDLGMEADRIRADEATKYKIGTMSEDFSRMNEILGRGLGIGTLATSREQANTSNAFQELLQRKERPYQLAQLPSQYAQVGSSAASVNPISGSSAIGSAMSGALSGAMIGKYLGGSDDNSKSLPYNPVEARRTI